mmetsp:Transcript_58737/g.169968  ORF Transcript_58737/g.169968 Transcript_58737/m.169968 type:complete len:271 (-) Transcript_58737:449-1261(-)
MRSAIKSTRRNAKLGLATASGSAPFVGAASTTKSPLHMGRPDASPQPEVKTTSNSPTRICLSSRRPESCHVCKPRPASESRKRSMRFRAKALAHFACCSSTGWPSGILKPRTTSKCIDNVRTISKMSSRIGAVFAASAKSAVGGSFLLLGAYLISRQTFTSTMFALMDTLPLAAPIMSRATLRPSFSTCCAFPMCTRTKTPSSLPSFTTRASVRSLGKPRRTKASNKKSARAFWSACCHWANCSSTSPTSEDWLCRRPKGFEQTTSTLTR